MLASLLPTVAKVAETFADDPGERVFPGEADLIERAVPARRREFITARRCARKALGRLGWPDDVAIRSGPRREPLWPAGVVGAITHCAGYRAAAVARATDLAALGVDAEPHLPLPGGVLESTTVPPEVAMLDDLARDHPGTHWDRLLFSAKESVYKAWFPLTGRWLGYPDADLVIDPAGSFTARLLIDGARTDGGPPLRSISGRYLVADGLILTSATVPPSRLSEPQQGR